MPENTRRFVPQQSLPQLQDGSESGTLLVYADADLPQGGVQFGSRVLAAWSHYHEPGLGRREHHSGRLSDRHHAQHGTPSVIDSDVHVANDRPRLDTELRDEEVVDAGAVLLA